VPLRLWAGRATRKPQLVGTRYCDFSDSTDQRFLPRNENIAIFVNFPVFDAKNPTLIPAGKGNAEFRQRKVFVRLADDNCSAIRGA